MQPILTDAQKSMQKSYEHFERALAKIRAERVTPEMLEGLYVDQESVPTPLEHLAAVDVVDASTLSIKPWEKKLLPAIERAIAKHNPYHFTPKNKDEVLYLHRPPVTQEMRKVLAKQVAVKAQEAKVAIQNIRGNARKAIKKEGTEDEVKLAEASLQKITNEAVKKIEALQKTKENELMR